MARALNRAMSRRGPVFADRYHAHLLSSPQQASRAVRYVLQNWAIHAAREGAVVPTGVDPYCSSAPHDGPRLIISAEWCLLRVGVARGGQGQVAA